MAPHQPKDLTLATALEMCEVCPADTRCSICFEECASVQLVVTNPVSNLNEKWQTTSEQSENKKTTQDHTAKQDTTMEVVRTKVCSHYFHRECIMKWLTSSTQPLNQCPDCRQIIYGSEPIKQTPCNTDIMVQDAMTREEVLEQFMDEWDGSPPMAPYNMLTDFAEEPIDAENDEYQTDLLIWASRR
ncbi:hypothetical protein P154DRAFT_575715 [Amniculicola lignicola CBS 123094]|uniref:RING-type domain-containing protein n=1 Tax=Amniculicola lignicola CBS 123094 TaxID=1392246 RepID=A0A6A5WIM8_9PLEO|nr:hypothetical protein P154DRAFT_575715 [Amniculicola lignicola CBS 123094]